MQTFLLAIAFASLQTAQLAAPPAPASGWQRVQVLPIGTSINVAAKTGHGNCKLKNVDADTLTCTHGKDIVFQRTDIVTVKVPRRGRSTLIGMAIGGGAGAGTGYAIGGCQAGKDCFVPRSAGAVILGLAGAGVGAVTGFFTNPAKSTIYTAP
jgi:hypothetical protein